MEVVRLRARRFACLGLLIASTAAGQVWTESEDARSFPESAAQVTRGSGQLTAIVGATSGSDLRDAYCIKIVDPASFQATTDPNTLPGASGDFNTRLFLFDKYGGPILANDDTPPSGAPFLSTLTGTATDGSGFVLTVPGEYVLVVAGAPDVPRDPTPTDLFDIGSGLDLVHARSPPAGRFDAWEGGTPAAGSYGVALAGVAYCQANVDVVFTNVINEADTVCWGDDGGQFPFCQFIAEPGGDMHAVALGFLDMDPHLDAVFANRGDFIDGGPNRVCLGDGTGRFTDCADVSADEKETSGVALGFVDGDSFLDAVFANAISGPQEDKHRVCLGAGDGTFSVCIASIEQGATGVALGHFDADANLDVMFSDARACLGNGDGTLMPCTSINIGAMTSEVALGFVDGDTNLDAVFAADLTNRVCLGDGNGGFPSCANVGPDAHPTTSVALGLIDGDSHLDAIFANGLDQRNRVCLGNGDGTFQPCIDVGADEHQTLDVALGFVDGDSNLDAIFANGSENPGQRNRVCLGNGDGTFMPCADVSADRHRSTGLALGEVGDLPIFVDGFESGDTSAWSTTVP